jgi:hypothetical protein
MLGNRQPQASAAIRARGGVVGLSKDLEQARLVLGRNTDAGIRDRAMQHGVLGRLFHQAHLHGYFPMVGKFHRVTDQIGQHLAQTAGIACDPGRQAGMQQIGQLRTFGMGLFSQEFQHTFDDKAQLEIALFKGELARKGAGVPILQGAPHFIAQVMIEAAADVAVDHIGQNGLVRSDDHHSAPVELVERLSIGLQSMRVAERSACRRLIGGHDHPMSNRVGHLGGFTERRHPGLLNLLHNGEPSEEPRQRGDTEKTQDEFQFDRDRAHVSLALSLEVKAVIHALSPAESPLVCLVPPGGTGQTRAVARSPGREAP